MAKNLARPLRTDAAIDTFLQDCLGIRQALTLRSGTKVEPSDVSRLIRDAENSVSGIVNETTLNSESCRDSRYRSTRDRETLRAQILEELITFPRPDDDEAIRLGSGGAKPRAGDPRSDRNAYIVTGLPASGKSTLVNRIADDLGAMIVDSDYAKRKFPEFQSPAGAQLVHEESAMIVEGGESEGDEEEAPSLIGYCIAQGFNIVIPKIGHDPRSLNKLRDALRAGGYNVHITAVVLPRRDATLRAIFRFLETKRYVPLGRIFDIYANDPALTYYRLRVEHMAAPDGWDSFGAVSSENFTYKMLDCSGDMNPASLFREQ
ncbi:zeta toxin family protein [Ralstonia pseudosolanacearum]